MYLPVPAPHGPPLQSPLSPLSRDHASSHRQATCQPLAGPVHRPHLLHLPNQQPPTQFYKVQFSPTSLPDCVSSKGPQAGEEKSPNLPPFALNSVCGTSVFMLCPYSSMPYLPNLPAPLSPASSSQRELIT